MDQNQWSVAGSFKQQLSLSLHVSLSLLDKSCHCRMTEFQGIAIKFFIACHLGQRKNQWLLWRVFYQRMKVISWCDSLRSRKEARHICLVPGIAKSLILDNSLCLLILNLTTSVSSSVISNTLYVVWVFFVNTPHMICK